MHGVLHVIARSMKHGAGGHDASLMDNYRCKAAHEAVDCARDPFSIANAPLP